MTQKKNSFFSIRDSLVEKTLTPAEKKKREEVAKAIERDQPGMPMAKKMAIATATAKKVAEEVEELDEAVSVKKKDYSWGKMMTVHHGNETSYPLHPEHQAKIKTLGDGEKTSFKDETKRTVTAQRVGDTIHLSGAGTSKKTAVKRSHFAEEVEELDEVSADVAKRVAQARSKSAENYKLTPTQSRRLGMKDKGGEPDLNAAKALKSAMKRGAKNIYEDLPEEVELDETESKLYDKAFDKYADSFTKKGRTTPQKQAMYKKIAQNAYKMLPGKSVKPNLPEEVEQIDEISQKLATAAYAKRSGTMSHNDPVARKKEDKAWERIGKRWGQKGQQKADAAADKYQAEEVEQIDEISAKLASAVARARDDSWVKNEPTATQKRRMARGSWRGVPDVNAYRTYRSAVKRGAEDPWKEEVELDEAMRHEIAGQVARFIGNKIDPVHGDIMHAHGKEAYRQAAYHIRKTVNDVKDAVSSLHDRLHKQLRTGGLATEEVVSESGGPVVFKKGNDHIEKYGDNKFAVYKDGKKTKYYKSMQDAKSALSEEKFKDTGWVQAKQRDPKAKIQNVAKRLATKAMKQVLSQKKSTTPSTVKTEAVEDRIYDKGHSPERLQKTIDKAREHEKSYFRKRADSFFKPTDYESRSKEDSRLKRVRRVMHAASAAKQYATDTAPKPFTGRIGRKQ